MNVITQLRKLFLLKFPSEKKTVLEWNRKKRCNTLPLRIAADIRTSSKRVFERPLLGLVMKIVFRHVQRCRCSVYSTYKGLQIKLHGSIIASS